MQSTLNSILAQQAFILDEANCQSKNCNLIRHLLLCTSLIKRKLLKMRILFAKRISISLIRQFLLFSTAALLLIAVKSISVHAINEPLYEFYLFKLDKNVANYLATMAFSNKGLIIALIGTSIDFIGIIFLISCSKGFKALHGCKIGKPIITAYLPKT